MTKTKDTIALENKLREEKKMLISELAKIGVVKNAKSPDDWQATPENIDTSEADSNEVADKIESYEGNTALVSELEGQLMEVDLALGKIEKGEFGLCEVCQIPVEDDRLEANPSARTCKAHMNEKLVIK